MITIDPTLITTEHKFRMTETWHQLHKGTLVGVYKPEFLATGSDIYNKDFPYLAYNNKIIRVVKLGIPLSKGVSDPDWDWVPIELLEEYPPLTQPKGMKPEFPPPSIPPRHW